MEKIEEEVMRVYPKTPKEITCASERQRREELRQLLRQRIERERLHTKTNTATETVGK